MVDLKRYQESKPHRVRRIVWAAINITLFRILPSCGRNALLRIFGARIGKSLVYRSVCIFNPANLTIGDFSCVGPHVELYSKDKISIGNNVVISQWAYICTASHDISSRTMKLKTAPIAIGDGAWVAAHAKILPGVSVGEGGVVALGAIVPKDVPDYGVVGGNPARLIKIRTIKAE